MRGMGGRSGSRGVVWSCLAVAAWVLASPTRASAAGGEVDLLQRTRATVWVSSWVGNDAYAPEKLVDGKLATAWNGRSGQLVGTEVGFFVPWQATATRIELTTGFTATDRKHGDLFTKNHRITRVELSREGKPLASFTLDASKRTLQALALPRSTRGGWFTLRVAAVRAGTTKWKEICISELRVFGRALAADLHPAKRPPVLLGMPLRRGADDRLCSAPVPAGVKSLANVSWPVLRAALLPRYDTKTDAARPIDGRIAACSGARQTDWKGQSRADLASKDGRRPLPDGRELLFVEVGVREKAYPVAGIGIPHGFIATARLDRAARRVVIDAVGEWAHHMTHGDPAPHLLGRVGGHLVFGASVHMSGTGGGGESAGYEIHVEDGDRIRHVKTFQTMNDTTDVNGHEEVGKGCQWPAWSCGSKLVFAGGGLRFDENCSRSRQGGKQCPRRKAVHKRSTTYDYRTGGLVPR